VIEIGREIVAVVVLVACPSFLKLTNLAVLPDHGGQGIGSALIAHAEYRAVKQNFREIRLNTHKNMADNLRLYGSLGWAEIARQSNTVTLAKSL
jgi:ribosomal protein S18 acetylase RimI-like enzyme